MKKLFILFFIMISIFVNAEEISNYKIDINVEQSGELSVIEYIEYDFGDKLKHGIIRDIPLSVKIDSYIIDIGFYDFAIELDNNMVLWQQSKLKSTKAGEILRLKIGSQYEQVKGKRLYKISYRVKKGVLPSMKDKYSDAIRWNIIGTGWKIKINNIEANFFLPVTLSSSDIELSSYTGIYGAKTSTASTNWIDNNHLRVNIPYLAPHEGATVEISYLINTLNQSGLDNIKPSLEDWFLHNWHIFTLIGFFIYLYMTLNKYRGFTDNRAIAVQYNAPKGISLLQAGVILDRFADDKDFAPALLELAYLGHLEIHQDNNLTNPVLIKKDSDTNTLTIDQRYLLKNVLFKGGKDKFIISSGSKSKAIALQRGFEHINNTLYKWLVKKNYMVENPQELRESFFFKNILLLLPILLMTIYTLSLQFNDDILWMLTFSIAFGSAGSAIILSERGIGSKIFGTVFIISGAIPIFMIEESVSVIEVLTGSFGAFIILMIGVLYTYRNIGQFTQKGAYTSKRLLGLKEFIQRVKEDEIERRLESDPLYLDKMLPYALLFNQTQHWLSFYEVLNVKTPTWYHGDISSMQSFSTSVNDSSETPSENGGDGFSGGGDFSGGGGGGGGGDSW